MVLLDTEGGSSTVKIYTKTGDTGQTDLLGGARVPKNDPRVEACGAVDELNAALGVALASGPPAEIGDVVLRLQHTLFEMGAELASPRVQLAGVLAVTDDDVAQLESVIDRFEQDLPQLTGFVLPGGEPTAAHLHVARCVCRRAERAVVHLAQNAPVREELLRYLNRLGDLLFVLARGANHAAGRADVPWQKRSY